VKPASKQKIERAAIRHGNHHCDLSASSSASSAQVGQGPASSAANATEQTRTANTVNSKASLCGASDVAIKRGVGFAMTFGIFS